MRQKRKTAFLISGIALCAAIILIHRQTPYSVASARVMVQSYALSGNGVAQTDLVKLDGGQRNLPVDWTVRLTSAASVGAALAHLGEDANSEAVESVRKNLYARLLPGSTVIEVNLIGTNERRLTDFLEALLAIQDQLWNSPERSQAKAILEELSSLKAQLQVQITQNAAQVVLLQSDVAIGVEERLGKLDSASMQVNLEGAKTRAESVVIEKELTTEPSNGQPVILSGEQRLEVMRIRSDIDEGEAQLAALEARYGPNHRDIVELKNRLEKLREKQRTYVGFEPDRLKAIARILGTTENDLQSKSEETAQTIRNNRRQQTTAGYLIAAANLEAAQNQLKWVTKEQKQVSLYYEGIVPPLVVLDRPGIRHGFQKKMTVAQYGAAVIGSVFLWFAYTMLTDARGEVRRPLEISQET